MPGLTQALALIVLLPAVGAAADLYVVPRGSDENPGTKRRPLATLEGARDAIRAFRAAGSVPDDGVTVWIRGGTYQRGRSFELTSEDSGLEGAPVTYRAHGDKPVRLVGGVQIPPGLLQPVTDEAIIARLPEEARGNVVCIDLSAAGVTDLGPEWPATFRGYAGWPEVYFGGRRLQLARWPNEGHTRIAGVVDAGSRPRFGETPDRPGKFTYSGDRPERWASAGEVFLKGYWCYKWYDETIKVDTIDTEQKLITMAAPHHYGIGGTSGHIYYALHLLEELDIPGECFIDRATGILYLWPPGDPATEEIVVSVLAEPMISMQDASHIVFRGLTLEAMRGSAINMVGGAGNLVAGCTVRHTASGAIVVRDGTGSGVVGCDVYDIGTSGISLIGGDRNTLTPCGHYAVNNHIHHFAELVHTYQNGIHLSGVGCRATNNLLHDTPHEPLGISGNDHTVELNEVYDVCLDTDDAGAIHQGRDWTWRGNVIRHNFFHHIGGGPAIGNQGVYLDDMMCGTEVSGNVYYRIHRANLFGGGRDNTLENSVIVDCPIPVHIDNRAMNWAAYHVDTTMKTLLDAVPYTDEPWRSRYPKLVGIWEDDPAVPKGNVVRSNLMVRCGEMFLAAEAREFGTIEGNVSTPDDPGFIAPERLDFRLREDAPILAELPDLASIPFDRIGLYEDEYRAFLPVKRPVLTPDGGAFVEETVVGLAPAARSGEAIIRYTLDGTPPAPRSPKYRKPIRLTETTTITAASFPARGPFEECSPAVSATFTAQRLGPGAGVYLSDLPALDILAHAGLKRDTNYAGDGQLSLGGEAFPKGLMLCPETTDEGGHGHVTYDLSGGLRKATHLAAVVGIDDAMGATGSVTFIVEVLRGDDWEQVFASEVMRGGQRREIDLEIAGARQLRLRTTDAGDNINADHANWAAARVY